MAFDLILAGGHILDPAAGLDGPGEVGFRGGKIAAVGARLDRAGAGEIVDVGGAYLSPGFIDLHTHVYWGGTSLGVDADALARRTGVTTFVDTGSAGPGNFHGFRTHVIDRSEARILAYLHVSFAGIFGFGKRVAVGEAGDLRLMAPAETVAVAEANRDVIVGIKVRIGKHAGGDSGVAPLDIALIAAEELSLPVMCHIDEPPPSYEAVLERLRPGDILTHCFRPFPNSPVSGQGAVKREVTEARARGVIFDVGHGMGSFAYRTARAMLASGFLPDTISSDVHALCIDGPAFDLPTTMSKFLGLGVSLGEVVRAVTAAPAAALRRAELGTFAPGAAGDATVFVLEEGRFDLPDVTGESLRADRRIAARGMVIGGRWRDAEP